MIAMDGHANGSNPASLNGRELASSYVENSGARFRIWNGAHDGWSRLDAGGRSPRYGSKSRPSSFRTSRRSCSAGNISTSGTDSMGRRERRRSYGNYMVLRVRRSPGTATTFEPE